ncbi:wax ester/triacylglycerol synthase family O-acyltransferase [Nocardia niigatensis]
MSRMTPLDAGFMAMEDADRHVSLGLGTVAIIEGPPPSRDEMRAYAHRALERHRRLRLRVRGMALGLQVPVWEEDPNFSLGHHIRWAALPAPGDEAALRDLIATELTARLDRDHPLWRLVVVENLAGGRWAMLLLAHHTMVDGVSEITAFESLCDPVDGEAIGATGPRENPSRSGLPATRGLLGSMWWALRLPYTVPRTAFGAIRAAGPVLYAAIAPAEASSLNGPIGRQRRYAIARTDLPQVREIGAAFGVTVNDIAVAAIAAAYRRLLLSRGEQPAPGKLRIVVPVSRRGADAKTVLDNRVSAMIPDLPIEVEDPVERLLAVHERIQGHKSRGEVEAERTILAPAQRLPFWLIATVFRLAAYYPQRGVAALATNIPGAPRGLAIGGRRVLEMWPCIPIALRVRSTIAILSYVDQLTFGITGDYDTTPDIDAIASGIMSEISVLSAHARGVPAGAGLRHHTDAGTVGEQPAGRS